MAIKTTAALALLLCSVLVAVDARLFLPAMEFWSKPSPADAPRHARELVHDNTWATLSTNSIEFPGTPLGHIVSYSDGIGSSAANATGEIFLFLMKMNPAVQNLEKDAHASLTISKAQEGKHACKRDVMDPTCWRLTLIGRVVPVTDESKLAFGRDALFSKHPEMESWPTSHGFSVYVLEIDTMLLLDFYGGAKHITPDDYYKIQLHDE